MPDGPCYGDDFYAWTQYQAEVLRSLPAPDNRFDREHVVEEIEDPGKSERDAVRSHIRRIIEHLLKLNRLSTGPRRSSRLDKACRTNVPQLSGRTPRHCLRNFTQMDRNGLL
jgi:Domain of unknown function DUF29